MRRHDNVDIAGLNGRKRLRPHKSVNGTLYLTLLQLDALAGRGSNNKRRQRQTLDMKKPGAGITVYSARVINNGEYRISKWRNSLANIMRLGFHALWPLQRYSRATFIGE